MTRMVGRHWRLAAFLIVGFGPFVPSLIAMRQFLLADNALGFVPFVIVIAAIAFWLYSFPEGGAVKRDVLVDVFLAVPATLLAFYVLYLIPGYLSWYYWLFRVDLLGLPLFVLASGIVWFGYQQVLRAAPAYAVLFLIWPYPIVRFQQVLVEPFIRLTAWLTGWAVQFLSLPYVQDPTQPGRFVSQHLADPDNFALIIAEACAGTSTFIAFALFAVASAAFTRGPFEARARWLVVGLGLSVILNFIRVVALLFASVTVGLDVATEVIHPVLGLLFFAGLVLLMLMLVRPFGLTFDRGEQGKEGAWVGAGAGGGRPLLALSALIVAGAIGIGILDARVQQYSFLDLGQGAPTIDLSSERDILVQVPGWDLEYLTPLGWTDLFGRSARGDVFAYQAPDGGPGIVVQSIVTDDKATLDRYPVEQCVLFHNDEIDSIRTVALPWGTTGTLVRSNNGVLWSSALAWQFPVRVGEEVWHARVLLLLDTEEPMVTLPDVPEVRALAGDLGVSLEPPDPDARLERLRAHVDLQLTALATSMIRQMVATGGPAAQTGSGG